MYKLYVDHKVDEDDQKKINLYKKMKNAIDNELTTIEKSTLELYFNHGINITNISKRLGVNKSTVSRNLSRAKKKLLNFIKYAI